MDAIEVNLRVSRDDFLRCFKHRVKLNRDRWGTVVRHRVRVQNIGTEEEPFLVVPLELSDRCTVINDSGISCLEDDLVVVVKDGNVKGMRTNALYPFQSIVPDEFKDCISVVVNAENDKVKSMEAEQAEIISEVPEVFREYLTLSVNSTCSLNGAVSEEENAVNVVDATATTDATDVTDDGTGGMSVSSGEGSVESGTEGIEAVADMDGTGGTEETADTAEGVRSVDVPMAVNSDGHSAVDSNVNVVVDSATDSGVGEMVDGTGADGVLFVPVDSANVVLDTHGNEVESDKERGADAVIDISDEDTNGIAERGTEAVISNDTVEEQTVSSDTADRQSDSVAKSEVVAEEKHGTDGTTVRGSRYGSVVSVFDGSGGTEGEEDKKVTLLDGTPVPNGIIYESDMSVLQFLKLNKGVRTEDELRRYFSDFAIKQAIRSGKIMRRKGRLFV